MLRNYENFLPEATINTWSKLQPFLPEASYLVGGTALTMHLKHRISRDLDFCVMKPFDTDMLLSNLQNEFGFIQTNGGYRTVNGWMLGTKVEIMRGLGQKNISQSTNIAGIEVLDIPDLLTMKLKVINDRGVWRDYFDIYKIDTTTHFRIEDGLEYFIDRFGTKNLNNYMTTIPKALSYTVDLKDDFGVNEQDKEEIVKHLSERIQSVYQKAQFLRTPTPPYSQELLELTTEQEREEYNSPDKSYQAQTLSSSGSVLMCNLLNRFEVFCLHLVAVENHMNMIISILA
ncbi:MAG: nucleotidyl transferase AbiEii/AbiGii toxin family protein [Candidatus Ancillula sp.]|jgi:hypothetical protein|nr:nucleotidyl transferase AbiEii/AbiGii toxin family protein [Candidatus Ancillula sp.]